MVRFFTLERPFGCVWNMARKEKSLEAGKPGEKKKKKKKAFPPYFFIQKISQVKVGSY